MRINISIPDDLLAKVDAIAKKMYVSRSAYISFAVAQKIQGEEALANFPDLVKALKEASDLVKSETQKTSASSEQSAPAASSAPFAQSAPAASSAPSEQSAPAASVAPASLVSRLADLSALK